MDQMKFYLHMCWQETLQKVRAPNQDFTRRLFEEIYRKYWEPGRHYHTVEHLYWCFSMLDYMVAKLPGIGSVELALWYHDFVYDPHSNDNEERSAEIAVDRIHNGLELPLDFALQVGQLILATKHVGEPKTREAMVLLDVDLSILGAQEGVFDKYEDDVRQEYAWVPEAAYRAHRSEILQRFLDRPYIYSTTEFRASAYEIRARANLNRSIRQLRTA